MAENLVAEKLPQGSHSSNQINLRPDDSENSKISENVSPGNAKDTVNTGANCDQVVKSDKSKVKKKKINSNPTARVNPPDKPSPKIFIIPGYNETVANQHFIQLLQKPHSKHPRAKLLCTICQYYCDSWSVVEQHISTNRHLNSFEDVADEKSIHLLPKPLNEQISAITTLLKKHVGSQGIYKLKDRLSIVKYLQEVIDVNFPGCKVELYGSSVYEVGLRQSDINVNMLVPAPQDGPRTFIKLYEVIKNQPVYREVESAIYSDVPKITFCEFKRKMKCCVTLNNSDACKLAQLLQKYMSIDVRAHQIAMAFRNWANLCNLDAVECGTLPAYAFTILVIFYMQQINCPVLPVLHEIPGLKHEELGKPDKLDVEELRKKWTSANVMNLGQLWLGLFKFYLIFLDMSEYIVSIKSSKLVKRSSKKWSGNRLAIEDPITNRNVSKTLVNGKTFTYLVACFRSTYLYFATLQMEKGSIFRRVQQLPPGIFNMEHLIAEREAFLNFILERHPCFLNEEETKRKKDKGAKSILKTSDSNYHNIAQFIVTPEQAALLYTNFNTKYLVYEFSKKKFIGNKNCPLVCILCREEGHHKNECPDEYLTPLEELPTFPDESLKILNLLCKSLYDNWTLPQENIDVRKELSLDLKTFLQPHFSDVCCELFGSSINGFGLKSSDIDICLYFEDNPSGEGLDCSELVKQLHNILKKYEPFTNLLPIATAKVPILKFRHRESQLDGDISFYNVLALKNTMLLQTFSEIDERVKVLGIVVKRFTKICDMCDASRGSLSSYAYVLMLIYFLQQCELPVLPVLQEIKRPESCEEYMIDGYDTYYFDDLKSLPEVWPEYGKNIKSAAELWIEFLCFYSEKFDFNKDVVCIRKKETMLKIEKAWSATFMAIEDPFDVDHNLGVGISRLMHNYIKKAFRKGRTYFGNPGNLPQCDSGASVQERAELYFNNRVVQGLPPDRGCHHCKRIGHLMKDCPNKPIGKKEGVVKKNNEKFFQNSQTNARNKSVRKGPNTVTHNYGVGGFKYAVDEKGRMVDPRFRSFTYPQMPMHYVESKEPKQHRIETQWRKTTNADLPILFVDPSSPGNFPYPLPESNVPVELQRHLREVPRERYASCDLNRESHYASQPARRKFISAQPPQVSCSELVDVYTQPTASSIPTLEFYNSVTGHPPQS